MDADRITAWLRETAAFQGAPEEALAELASAFSERPLAANEVVVSEGDTGGEFFLLAEGRLCVTGTKDGERKQFGTIASGETFGEIASLTGGRRLATVTAEEEGLLLVLPGTKFQTVLHRHPSVAKTVLLSLERYLQP